MLHAAEDRKFIIACFILFSSFPVASVATVTAAASVVAGADGTRTLDIRSIVVVVDGARLCS